MSLPALRRLFASFGATLCCAGLVLGALFVAASLTPTLVPRSPYLQGALSGLCFAVGYGLGWALRGLWRAFELPEASGRMRRRTLMVAGTACGLTIVMAMWWHVVWQNRLRALMQLPDLNTSGLLAMTVIAVAVFVLLLVTVRLFTRLKRALARRFKRRLPPRAATFLALTASALIFWNLGNGVLARAALHLFDGVYSELDARIEEDRAAPTDSLKSGGPGSFLTWQTLSRQGRRMIADGPDREQIEALTDQPAREPLRVYVGLASADTPMERARLALAELQRIGAFDRGHLVIATPTGTGWVDEESQDALEYVLAGDVATVAVQYSYFASWLALLSNSDYGVETSRAVFRLIYEHWHSLPKTRRPRLYLHGLSLGALNSDLSHDLQQVIDDPFDGALWSGPPFNMPTWRNAVAARDAGTTAWLPVVRGGAVVRFTAQTDHLEIPPARWGAYRVVFLQYASDAVTFFDPQALWRKPEWMQPPRGPDVSTDIVWIPVVTFLQLGFDLMVAVSPPKGFGHVYHFDHYVDAWTALLGISEQWPDERRQLLKQRVAEARNTGRKVANANVR